MSARSPYPLPFPLGRHPLTSLGVLVSAGALAGILAGLLLDFLGRISSPYAGILLYGLLPLLLLLGLFLQFIGTRLSRKAGQPAEYVLDWARAADRRRAFVGLSILGLTGIGLAGATHESLEYMGSDHFCGEVCHRTMEPQAVTHRLSTHSKVACVDCHIGPGVNGFIRAKLGGLRQSIGEITGHVPTPVPAETPDHVLGRVVCERCHDSQRDHGVVARNKTTFGSDAEQAREDRVVKTRVGSPLTGIHAHLGMQIRYLSPDHGRTISQIELVRADGSRATYRKEGPAAGGKWAEFGCTSCHSRVGHEVASFEKRLDQALRAGTLNPEVKGLKEAALAAVPEPDAVPGMETYLAIRQKLRETGGSPAVGAELERLYAASYYPEMKTGPATYLNALGHDGCYRCHGALAAEPPAEDRLPKNTNCMKCHVMP